MVTQRPAFSGNTAAVIAGAILERAPIPLSHLNPKLRVDVVRIVDRMLEKDRALRYQSASDLCSDLERLKRDMNTGQAAAPAHDARRTLTNPGAPGSS